MTGGSCPKSPNSKHDDLPGSNLVLDQSIEEKLGVNGGQSV